MARVTVRFLLGMVAVSVSVILFSLYYTMIEKNLNVIPNIIKNVSSSISFQSLQPVFKSVTRCKPTKLLVGSKLDRCNSTVVKRTMSSWMNEDDVCNLEIGDFVKTTLRSPAGNTPIYVYSKQDDQWVSGNVISQGIWERGGVDLMYYFMKQNLQADFVDLGANIGVYGLTFAKMGRRVILIDPLLGNVKRLCKSVRDGKFSNEVYVVHNAISDQRFKVGFGKYKGNVGGTYIKETKSNESEVAQAIRLDDLLEIFNFSKVIMKIDVETHETRALLGGDKFFSTVDVKVVQVEWNSHRKDGNEIIKFLTKHNMKPYIPSLREEALDIASFDKWPGDILWKKV